MASILIAVLALAAPAGPAAALDLTLPGEAELTREEISAADTYFLPIGPFADGKLPLRELEGHVIRQAWRITDGALTTLDLVAPIREQLAAAGYDIVLDCVAGECGGFDFRSRIDVLPAPDMFVDLFDFRFLAAAKTNNDGADHVSILVSVVGGRAYVQIVAVGRSPSPVLMPTARPAPPAPLANAGPGRSLAERLLADGRVILRDLEFASGAATLGEGGNGSLARLAEFLNADSTRRIVLVGHTDAVGRLAENLELSRQRAAAVLERLAETHGVARAQMQAEGAGYLAPIASNRTAAGREANRRVEAVLLSAGDGG